MVEKLYKRKNGSQIKIYYPEHGRRRRLMLIQGTKVRSFTGPNGRGITLRTAPEKFVSLSLKKCVDM